MTIPNNANVYLPPVIALPSALQITAISQSNPMVITVNANIDQVNTYLPLMNVKLTVPASYGMWQSNNLIGNIISATPTQLTVNIDSSNFDPFIIPAAGSQGPATVASFGSKNLQYNNFTRLVPFQSFNNVGN